MDTQWIQPLIAFSIAFTIAFRAHRRKSLSTSGALAGFLVMALHIFIGFRFAAMLLAFFFTSSSLTKKGADMKKKIDPEYKEGGQRNWLQVLANSAIASVLVVAIWVLTEGEDKCLNSKESPLITSLIGGIIGHYSCCNGDTWSSEIGILSDDRPLLITTFKSGPEVLGFLVTVGTVGCCMMVVVPWWWSIESASSLGVSNDAILHCQKHLCLMPVRRGTNGGVTKTGLLAAAAGGSVIGLSYVLLELSTMRCGSDKILSQLLVIPVATVAGLGGSIIDSLLGATLQFSGYCSIRQKVVGKPGPTVKKISGLSILDNNAVNLVAILLTTILTSIACYYIF